MQKKYLVVYKLENVDGLFRAYATIDDDTTVNEDTFISYLESDGLHLKVKNIFSWSEVIEGLPFGHWKKLILKYNGNENYTEDELMSFKYGYMITENMYCLKNEKPHKYDLIDIYKYIKLDDITPDNCENKNKYIELGRKAFLDTI